ncbi:hypothetical protein FKM82_008824 [Ascaphus truei]
MPVSRSARQRSYQWASDPHTCLRSPAVRGCSWETRLSSNRECRNYFFWWGGGGAVHTNSVTYIPTVYKPRGGCSNSHTPSSSPHASNPSLVTFAMLACLGHLLVCGSLSLELDFSFYRQGGHWPGVAFMTPNSTCTGVEVPSNKYCTNRHVNDENGKGCIHVERAVRSALAAFTCTLYVDVPAQSPKLGA